MDFQYNKGVRKNSPNPPAGIIKCPNKLIVAIYFIFFFDNNWWTCFVNNQAMIFVVKYNKYLSTSSSQLVSPSVALLAELVQTFILMLI